MKKVTLFVVAALFAGIGQIAMAQHAGHMGPQRMTGDQARIAVQGICPVSGQKLGAHGTPVKAKIGQEEVFLCCQGCFQGKIGTENWATIHANIARAQGKCPVMGNPLPENPKWTIVNGRIVYVCCPPCVKKIEADPATYLQKVDSLCIDSLMAGQASR